MTNEPPLREDKARAASSTGITQLLERAVLLLLFAGLIIGVLAVLRPFATAILFGTILAIAAWPLRDFLLRCGLKRGLDATLLLLLALAVVVLPDGGGARPGRASDAGGESSAGLLRQRSAGPFLACRSADRRRSPRPRLGPGDARPGRHPGRARTLLRFARTDVRRGGRGARSECSADHPVAGRGDILLGQRRCPSGDAARHPPAACW